MSGPEPKERTIPRQDVDDVVGVASELAEAEAQRVRVADMKEIAAELAIDPRHVEPAIAALERRRAEEKAAADRASAARRAWMVRLGTASVVALVVTLGAVAWTHSTLAPRWAEVEARRAQVETVLERRADVEAIWADRAPSLDRDAELAGAENRVGVERRRYDEAAADYNAAAAGLPHALVCGLAGVPCHAPLSSEVFRAP